MAAQVQVEPHRRLWFMTGIRYGSGLPVELEDEADEPDDGENPPQPISPAILDKVNFERGRIAAQFQLGLCGLGLQALGAG